MQNCLPENTVLLIKDSTGEVRRVTLDYFDPMFDEKPDPPALDSVKVLGRNGWTELVSIGRRRLWEGEELLSIRTRSGQVTLTSGHELAVKRGTDDLVVAAKDVGAGDAVLMLELPALGKNARPVGETPVFRPFGVLSVIRSAGYGGAVYRVETADQTLVASDFLTHTA